MTCTRRRMSTALSVNNPGSPGPTPIAQNLPMGSSYEVPTINYGEGECDKEITAQVLVNFRDCGNVAKDRHFLTGPFEGGQFLDCAIEQGNGGFLRKYMKGKRLIDCIARVHTHSPFRTV